MQATRVWPVVDRYTANKLAARRLPRTRLAATRSTAPRGTDTALVTPRIALTTLLERTLSAALEAIDVATVALAANNNGLVAAATIVVDGVFPRLYAGVLSDRIEAYVEIGLRYCQARGRYEPQVTHYSFRAALRNAVIDEERNIELNQS